MVQLDVLRGIAILLVLCRHAVISPYRAGVFRPLAVPLYKFGWTGVDLFFVLSGFLIGGLLFKEIRTTGRLDVKRFLVRRGLKIWPAYFAFVAFVFVDLVAWRGHTLRTAFVAILPNLLHLQSYLPSPRGITWSLAVEEHFYLVLPLLLLVLIRGRERVTSIAAIPVIAVVLVIVCTALRIRGNWHRPFEMYTHLTPTHLRIDGLMFGVLLAYVHHMHPEHLAWARRHGLALLAFGLLLVSPMLWIDLAVQPFVWTIGYTMLYLGYGCILIACVYTPLGEGVLGRALGSPPARVIAFIGLFSYSIYLWQFDLGLNPTSKHLLPHLPLHPASLRWLLAEGAGMGAAIVAGIVMSKLIEMPVLALRDRLFPARLSQPVRPPAAAVSFEADSEMAALSVS